MSIHRLNHSFTAGELSPLMNARKDFDRYKNGCKKLYNMISLAQGAATRRPGTKYIYNLNDLGLDDTLDPTTYPQATDVRIIPFVFSENQSFAIIVFYEPALGTTLAFATDEGLVMGTNTACPYSITNRYAYTGPGTYYFSFTESDGLASVTSVVHTTAAGVATTLVVGTDYTVATTTTRMTFTLINPSYTAGDILTIVAGLTAPAVPTNQVVTVPTGHTLDILDFDWAQSADEMHITQDDHPPITLTRYANDVWRVLDTVFLDEPDDWSSNNYPAKVIFHQQRMILASTAERKQTIWTSKAGDLLNFTAGVSNDDAITFTLDSGTQNKIKWMESGKSLHIGTLGDEWTVTGGSQSAITPSNLLAQKQTNNGSEGIKPITVGNTVLFVEKHGRVINEFVYDYTFDNYKTSDLAILSPHMTENYSITDWTYQQTPNSIIWAIRSDGHLLGLTYQRQHKVVGWHEHDTDVDYYGEFKAITSIPGNTREDDVWVVVKRLIPTGYVWYIEKFTDMFKGTAASEALLSDCHLVYDNPGSPPYANVPTTISGLDHLIGRVVQVVADGTIHESQPVDGSGEIELDKEYGYVVVGLPYISEVRPMLSDLKTEDGTVMGRMQRINKLDIDLYRSLGMTIGRYDMFDGETTEEIPFRRPTDLMGVQVPLYTGIISLDFAEGFNREAEYFIRQTQPLPLTIRGIIDTIEVFD